MQFTDIWDIAHLDAVEIARILHHDTSLMNLLLSRRNGFRSNHSKFMDRLSAEQKETLCKRIDNLARRGVLADWGYAVPIASSPSPSPAVNHPGSSTTHQHLPSMINEPPSVADGVPTTDPFNPPTSPIEPPNTDANLCVNYVPVEEVGSHNLGTKLVPVSELNSYDNIVLLTGASNPEDDLRYTIDASPLHRTVSIPLTEHLELF